MIPQYRQNKINDKIEENKRKIRYFVKRSKLPFTVISILLGLALAYFLFYKTSMFYNSHEVKFQSPIIIQPPFKILNRAPSIKPKKQVTTPSRSNGSHILSPLPPEPTTTPITKEEATPSAGVWVGKVSHYSRAGCLGCSPNLITASGEALDDSKLTMAFNHLPMGTLVRVTNLTNNKSAVVKVNDTGGFEPLGRIADLSLATQQTLGTRTDVDDVKIEVL